MKKKKRVLLITYYWPPGGGITVLRCLKLSKYLRQFGWEPIIYTAQNAHYPTLDYSNEKDIVPDLEIIKGKIWEPYHIYKFITGKKKDANVNNVFYTDDDKKGLLHNLSVWIRSNFFIPDARARWIKPSVQLLTKYLDEHPVDAIISNGPPHSNTRIATQLKKKFNIPWLADFQDPWTQVDYFKLLKLSKRSLQKHQNMEREVFKYADAISIVSKQWKSDLESIGARDVEIIPWGYDSSDYTSLNKTNNPKFTISHLGIMGYDRNPTVLFEVLASMLMDNPSLAHDLELKLIGQVDFTVRSSIKKYKLEPYTDYTGSVSRNEALTMAYNSSVLLLLINQQQNAKGRIPGKLFEYMALRRSILSLALQNGDVSKILSETNAGTSLEYNDKNGIRDYLSEKYTEFKSGKINSPVNSQINRYSNQETTKQFAAILDKISTPS